MADLCDKPVEYAVARIEAELADHAELVMKFKIEDLFDGARGELTCHWRTDNAPAIHAHLWALQRGAKAA